MVLGGMLGWALLSSAVGLANAAVQMPLWFGDNMILQINTGYGARAFLNGRARPGEKVVVQVGRSEYPTVADENGEWIIQVLEPHSTVNITVTGEDGPPVVALDVQAGDVFFCSGQSNMVFPLKLAFNVSDEMATLAKYPNFRFFHTAQDYSSEPQWDLKPPPSACDKSNATKCAMSCGTTDTQYGCNKWVTSKQILAQPKRTYLGDFSAVCFMTVRDIAAMHTGTRPLALIQSAWGGTRVEAWMSEAAIADAANRVAPPHNIFPPPGQNGPNNVSVLYNAMVAPWNHFAVRAATWYQGEANANQKVTPAAAALGATTTNYYSQYLQSMARSWRDLKGMGDFAFMTMMLPPSVSSSTPLDKQLNTGRMEVRMAELEAAPHSGGLTDISGVPVTIDMGGSSAWGYDHPPNKNEMAFRLALQTVHAAYAVQGRLPCQDIPSAHGNRTDSLWTGPVLQGAALSGAAVEISLQAFSAAGLALKDVNAYNIDGKRNDCVKCCAKMPPFELQAEGNASWVRVAHQDISLHDSTIRLAGPSVPAGVTAVRYAWSDYVDCVVVNNDSLVLAPFVIDVNASTVIAAVAKPAQADQAGPPMKPPMGFNSWNYYHCNIDEVTVMAVIDAIHSNGMQEAGYEYVNIDDCWQVVRTADGKIQPDPVRFPSGMKALADYAHSKGLKFGVYTARGSRTCQNRPGAYAHEMVDAATYCEWGLDYLKNDNCGGTNWPAGNTSWINFQKGFDLCYEQTGRYIFKSIEYCESVDGCGAWIGGVANSWRTVGDLQATWESVLGNIHQNNKMAAVVNGGQGAKNKQGNFNDADMMEVGNVGLSVIEQYSHMSLWCIAGSPLLAGTDIVHASATTLAILANAEVTAINQDLGLQGKLQGVLVGAAGNNTTEVWAKQLADGHSVAVVLLNMGDSNATLTANWTQLGLTGEASVRDLWAKSDLPAATGLVSAEVQPHGVRMFKLTTKAAVRESAF